MKKSIILFLLLTSYYSFSQSFLKAIENEIEIGNLEKAKKQIEVLKKNNNHFCGNSHAELQSEIGFLESKISVKEKNYEKSLKILNSIEGCAFGAKCEKRDSLKIETLFLKYGKEKVIKSFKNKSELKVVKLKFLQYKVYLTEINYTFSFYSNGFNKDYEHPKYGTVSRRDINESFIDMCKELKFYKIIE